MIMYEQDPEVLQWGLQLFESDPYYNCAYGDTISPDEVDYNNGQHFGDDHYDTECCNVEYDELIARALQEELSQLAVVEAPESPCGEEDNLQVPDFQEEWLSQSVANYYSGKWKI